MLGAHSREDVRAARRQLGIGAKAVMIESKAAGNRVVRAVKRSTTRMASVAAGAMRRGRDSGKGGKRQRLVALSGEQRVRASKVAAAACGGSGS